MRAPRILVLFASEEPEYTRWVARLAERLEEDGARTELRDVESWLSGLAEEEEFDRILVIGSPRLKRLCDEAGLSEWLGGGDRDLVVPVLGRGAWSDSLPGPFGRTDGFDLTTKGPMDARSRALRRRLFPSRESLGGVVGGDGDFEIGTDEGGYASETSDADSDGDGIGGGGGGYRSRGPWDGPATRSTPSDPVDGPPFEAPPRLADRDRPSEPPPAPVQVTTVSPTAVEPGARFRVEVVFHVEGYEVESEEGQRIDESVATLALREGATLTVRLVSVDEGAFAIDDPEAPLVWGPPSRKVDFRLRAAKDLEAGVHDLRVEYWCGEVQLARTYLEITVGRQPASGADEPSVTRRPLPRSAFASYAHVDKVAVAGRVDSLKAVGIDVFLDSLDIRQGADWQEVLERELLGRDSLLLFWSTAAKASEWVEREWRFALDHRGLEGVIPNALEPADACPPPKELASLQFGSVLTELLTSWRHDAAG